MSNRFIAVVALALSVSLLSIGCPAPTPPADGATDGTDGSGAATKTPETAPEGLGRATGASPHGGHGAVSRSKIAALPMTAPVLSIDGVTFTRAELERTISQHAVVAGIPPQSLDAQTRDALESPAYEKLIERHLLGAEAKRRGLWPSEADVGAEKAKLVATLPEGKTLAEALASMNTDEKSFVGDLASDVAIAKLFEAMKKEQVAPDEATLVKVYEENKAKLVVPDSASAMHILVKVPKEAPQADIDAALAKVKAIRKEVAGKDEAAFKKVASEKSEDPSAKQNGGDLGTFAKGDMVPAFEEAAFTLKAGELSQPVRSDFGFHVIRGGGVKKGGQKTFAEVKQMISDRETVKAFMTKVDGTIDEMRKKAKITRIEEPMPSPLTGNDGTGSKVPGWKPTGHNADQKMANPHAP